MIEGIISFSLAFIITPIVYLKSERYLEKAINQYPFDVDLNLMLGWTKIALGKISEAKALFQVAQRHSPHSTEVKTAIDFINKK